MNKRTLKKKARSFMDWFTQEKIPAAFNSEAERKQYVSAWARMYVGQSYSFQECAQENRPGS